MLLFTIPFGGLLLMMGHHSREEALFYYFRLEDQIPENHLLRLIDGHVNLDFVRAKLKNSYSAMGRPSVDPELLLRMLLIGYLYGVTSERKLVEELGMHLAWQWFTGLGFDQEIPHHSTFSKNRHVRFQESNLFQEIFEEIVARCVEAGLVKGEPMSVDGSFIQANADHHRRVAPEQLAEVAKVNQTVREYLAELEQENPVEAPVPKDKSGKQADSSLRDSLRNFSVGVVFRYVGVWKCVDSTSRPIELPCRWRRMRYSRGRPRASILRGLTIPCSRMCCMIL
jgi:transposase